MSLYAGLYDELPTGKKDEDRKPGHLSRVEYNPSVQFVAPVLLRKKVATAAIPISKPKVIKTAPPVVPMISSTVTTAYHIQEPFIQPTAEFSLVPVENEYDPFKPNDYDDYLQEKSEEGGEKEKENLKNDGRNSHGRDGERERERYRERERDRGRDRDYDRDRKKRDDDRDSRKAEFAPPTYDEPPKPQPVVQQQPNINLNETAAEAIARRLAMSRPSNQPSNQSRGGETYGARLLGQMGWKDGKGLGKNDQGISAPLEVQKVGNNAGTIVRVDSNKNALINATTVILLENMVGPGEVDDDLQPEVVEECTIYGNVVKCLIFEVPGGVVPDDHAVRIFVQFDRIESARKAILSLNGRFFGGRTVRAAFFSEKKFIALDLAPDL